MREGLQDGEGVKFGGHHPPHIYFFFDYTIAFDCMDHNKLENSSRDGNTRLPDLPL